ncbi:MAG: radical SAM family heme chaperone HemW [Oligoflexus sp.]|nr:radical SAM family heme chaperone HemW [Oligoflexus sp.]
MHPIGLYLHLPFCTRICHYCDFVKSALYSEEQKKAYLHSLESLLDDYLKVWDEVPGVSSQLYSVFWGGGTPSLVTHEIAPIMRKILAHTAPDAEITLEANPEHINEESLRIWASHGINRISLGVQSFHQEGLKALTREHTAEQALEAVRLVRRFIPNCNVDLIYGWPGQTERDWAEDIAQLISSGATHASLYNLTFEGSTPFARRVARGKMHAIDDDRLYGFYETACRLMTIADYEHEEVSNWHLPGHEARHNGLYWHGGSYLALGAGAHSFLQELGPYGTRWQQSGNWRTFVPEPMTTLQGIITRQYNQIDGDRGIEAWILEVVSSGLRTSRGINISAIELKSGYSLVPRPILCQALELGLLWHDKEGQLFLHELEWFRETRWSLEVALSFIQA